MLSIVALAILPLASVSCATGQEASQLKVVAPSAQPQSVPQEAGSTAPNPHRVPISIVSTSDVHGWVAPHEHVLDDGTVLQVGGYGALSGYTTILWDHFQGRVVLVDAGDMLQGTYLSNSKDGRPVIELKNLLGYKAAAIGNHEFDYGAGQYATTDEERADVFGALKARANEASFPMLMANVHLSTTGEPVDWPNVRPYSMINAGGVMVGVVGVLTMDTVRSTRGDAMGPLVFIPKEEAAVRYARRLRERGADTVVVIAHSGGDCPSYDDPRDSAECIQEAPVFQMANSIPEGLVDVIVAGHSHQHVAHFVNGIAMIQGPPLNQGIGRVDLVVDTVAGRIVPEETVIHPPRETCLKVFSETGGCDPETGRGDLVPAKYMGQEVVPVPEVQQAMERHARRVEEVYHRPLGKAALAEPIVGERHVSSPLGNLITDIMLASFPEAQVAISNSGGLRADIASGPVTFGKVYDVLPFDNPMAEVRMSGRQLRELVNNATRTSMLQVSGIRATVDRAKECRGEDPVVSLTLSDRETPVEDDDEYLVVMSEFMADSMGNFVPSLLEDGGEAINVLEEQPNQRQTVVRWFERQMVPIRAPRDEVNGEMVDTRIEVLNADAPQEC